MFCFYPIIFQNLRKEMAKKNITIRMIARRLGIPKPLLKDKLEGNQPINLDEALRIRRLFFPEYDLYYLFHELVPNEDPRYSA